MWLSAVQLGNAMPISGSEALDFPLAPDKK